MVSERRLAVNRRSPRREDRRVLLVPATRATAHLPPPRRTRASALHGCPRCRQRCLRSQQRQTARPRGKEDGQDEGFVIPPRILPLLFTTTLARLSLEVVSKLEVRGIRVSRMSAVVHRQDADATPP